MYPALYDPAPRLVVDGREVCPLERASTRRARGRGLLGREGVDGAVWLPRVRSVHTVGMRFPIDVAWLDHDGRVRRIDTLRPGRVTRWVAAAAGMLEAEAGAFARWGLRPGSRVEGLRAPGAV